MLDEVQLTILGILATYLLSLVVVFAIGFYWGGERGQARAETAARLAREEQEKHPPRASTWRPGGYGPDGEPLRSWANPPLPPLVAEMHRVAARRWTLTQRDR